MLKPILSISVADFLVRSAYQLGKTPLLPIFAHSLGASDAFLGIIVSVSTMTGLVLKPIIGFLSDMWGRKYWLLVGTAFFTFVPFIYSFVDSPQALLLVRLIHGTATAIYGPVSLAYVAERSENRKGELLGWFGIAKTSGYIIGPLAAGWLLLHLKPEHVFTIIGIISSIAFIPVALLPEKHDSKLRKDPLNLLKRFASALRFGAGSSIVWISGFLDAWMYMAVYAVKAFLPIYGILEGFNVLEVGIFFAVQETVHLLINPIGGRMGDKIGYPSIVAIGMILMSFSLITIPFANHLLPLLVIASLIGLAQAMVFPSTLAMISLRFTDEGVATGMATTGSLKNAGKIAGPVFAGFLITIFDYDVTLILMGLLLITSALILFTGLKMRYDPVKF